MTFSFKKEFWKDQTARIRLKSKLVPVHYLVQPRSQDLYHPQARVKVLGTRLYRVFLLHTYLRDTFF